MLTCGCCAFYIEASCRTKTCTEVQWIMPSSVDSIPCAKIADIDFSKPKSRIKRAAHCNNACEMLTNLSDIEKTWDLLPPASMLMQDDRHNSVQHWCSSTVHDTKTRTHTTQLPYIHDNWYT